MSPHGTWQTTGGGSDGVLGLAVVIGAVVLLGSGVLATAVAALTSLLEIILFSVLTAVAIVTVAGLVVWRKFGYHAPPVPLQAAAAREARQVRAAQRPAIAAPAQHFHIHLHGNADADAVPAALKAIRDGEHHGQR